MRIGNLGLRYAFDMFEVFSDHKFVIQIDIRKSKISCRCLTDSKICCHELNFSFIQLQLLFRAHMVNTIINLEKLKKEICSLWIVFDIFLEGRSYG